MIELLMIGLGLLLAYQQYMHGRQTRQREKDWTSERAELLTRIQHPEILVGHAQERPVPDEQFLTKEDDEIDLVGTVVTGDGDGD